MWWIPCVLWAAGIVYLSTKTGDELPKIEIPYLDKIVHFTLYAILSILIFCGARFGRGLRFGAAALLACLLASAYGVTDEIHQTFTAGRSQDIFDWVADTVGAVTVFGVFALRPKEAPSI